LLIFLVAGADIVVVLYVVGGVLLGSFATFFLTLQAYQIYKAGTPILSTEMIKGSDAMGED
jgi:hypothetical protein